MLISFSMTTKKGRKLIISFRIPLSVSALALSVVLACGQAYALTSRDLIRLKQAGVPENLISLMLYSGYENADEVISLEKAGFGAATIKAFILSNGGERGDIVYSTKGLFTEDLPPCGGQNAYGPYWRDMLPDMKLFISPEGKSEQGQGKSVPHNTNSK